MSVRHLPRPRGLKRLLFGAALLLFSGCATFRQAVALRTDPLSADEHVQLARSYEGQALWDDAQREWTAAIKASPKNVPALLGAGNLAYRDGRLDEAERLFRRALKRDRINAGTQNNLAMVYLAKNDLEKAERLATVAAENARMKPYAEETLAQIAEKRGRPDDADRHWDAALAAAPEATLREALEASRKEWRGKRRPS